MPKENNKMQVDIENLFKQNVNDLSSIKELYRKLEEIEEKIVKIKYIDSTLAKKLKNEYESLKRIILSENVQVELNNKIEETKTELTNNINEFRTQMDTIANISNGININSLLQSSKRVILPKGVYSIDVTMPKGTTLIGDGEDTWIQGNLIVDSNCTVENLKIGTKGKSCTLSNNTTSVIFNNVTFTGGVNNSQGSFWVNDKKVSDIKFVNCKFINGEYNGVTLVDKGTDATHIDSITFDNCYFKDNKRMNIECLVRKGANDIVSGYKNITLKNSTLIKNVNGSDSNINISFDSNSLTSDSLIKEGGFSKIDNCYIEGGIYALEIAGATNMIVVNNKIYPYEETTNILSISALKNIKNNLIFNNNKVYGYNIINFEGLYNNINSNYLECNSLILRNVHYSNINNNEIISTKSGVPIIFESSSNNIFANNSIKCLNATYIFGFYYEETKYNNVFNNKIDSNVKLLHEYQLGSLKKDNICDNYDNTGLKIDNLIRVKNRTSFSTTTDLFKLKINEETTQPELLVNCKWFGRHNNNTIGGKFTLNFGKYNQKGNLPVINSLGTEIIATVTNENNDYTYTISTTANSSSNCIIEIISTATNINLVDTV